MMNEREIAWVVSTLFLVCAAGVVIALLLLTGCGSIHPECADNPRNMECMTPDQLEKELNQ